MERRKFLHYGLMGTIIATFAPIRIFTQGKRYPMQYQTHGMHGMLEPMQLNEEIHGVQVNGFIDQNETTTLVITACCYSEILMVEKRMNITRFLRGRKGDEKLTTIQVGEGGVTLQGTTINWHLPTYNKTMQFSENLYKTNYYRIG